MILRGLPADVKKRRLIAIDLGYSRDLKSCAIVTSDQNVHEELTFGKALERTAELLNDSIPSILILEAVLSTYHRPDGNPDIRGVFEKGRGWYYGPGVTTLAAAMRFLRQLDTLVNADSDVLLAEAFLSNKKAKTRHLGDAQTICQNFWSVKPKRLHDDCQPILDIVSGIPSVRVFK